MKKSYLFGALPLAAFAAVLGGCSSEASSSDYDAVGETGEAFFQTFSPAEFESTAELKKYQDNLQTDMQDEEILHKGSELYLRKFFEMKADEEESKLGPTLRDHVPFNPEEMKMADEPEITEYENLDVSTISADFTDGDYSMTLDFIKRADNGEIEVFDAYGINTEVDLADMEEEMQMDAVGSEDYPEQLQEEQNIE